MAGLPTQGEILRFVEMISKEKSVDRDVVFTALEQALAIAAKKHLQRKDAPIVKIDRETGAISAWDGEIPIDTTILGRIEYQAAHQMFIQKLREAESETVFTEFAHKKGDIVTAAVLRFEGRNIVCKIGDRAEATLLKADQVPGEEYRIGDRVRAYVSEVEKRGKRVTIFISRAHEEFVRRLFELEVPEIADGTVVIKGIAREPGYRTKIAVHSLNERVDCLGACVGVRGSRIRNVVDTLCKSENVDIVRWSGQALDLIQNALKPAEVAEVILDEPSLHATVYVLKEQLSQAIGKGGRNERLASKLTGWEIDIYELGATVEGTAPEPAPQAAEATPPAAPEPATPSEPPKTS
ncbi:MAG: transcription termination factor NusA [Planctomycetes bacterium]|nr:transcription termination factor NusA [Planctomycetota bacterium]